MSAVDSPILPSGPLTTPIDGGLVAADFPLLRPADAGSSPHIAYLDSAASAQKPSAVLAAMDEMYRTSYANVHRGVYRIAAEATARFEAARGTIARFVGAASPREVVFTSGTTAAVNTIAWGWGLDALGAGDIVVCTELEHHSNLVPWQQVALRTGASIRYLRVDESGTLDLSDLDRFAAEGRVRLVTVGHVSNAIGTVNEVAAVSAWAREHGALTFVDGAQAAPHRPLDVTELGCDFYAFSGHKLPGPTGIGILWGRADVLDTIRPFQYGGEMIRKVELESTTFNDLPWKFEAGTPPIVEAVGLAAAVDYLEALGLDRIHQHEQELTAYGAQLLAEIPGLALLGPTAPGSRGGILSFTLDCAHPHDIASILDSRNVCIRAGHHCAQPLMARLGHSATARASVYMYNTREDLDRLAEGLNDVVEMFSRGRGAAADG